MTLELCVCGPGLPMQVVLQMENVRILVCNDLVLLFEAPKPRSLMYPFSSLKLLLYPPVLSPSI